MDSISRVQTQYEAVCVFKKTKKATILEIERKKREKEEEETFPENRTVISMNIFLNFFFDMF